ncbi:putative dehydrogenase/reductase SDR family member 4-like isoform X7 [Apostichopus japonicus]|uniref:Putative dehydrogenase/reductase SDR family member 4-like isoform X7 n=1 Tax=Stichopus japonicus TaxID=307972 RepID=A0A2G8JVD1_STIJA|nr:putative dehydrogenase/reductase SDR family member 4-like isoform X7 [Apostichopus japonicus]
MVGQTLSIYGSDSFQCRIYGSDSLLTGSPLSWQIPRYAPVLSCNQDKFLQTMASATTENPCIGRFDGKVAICTASSAGIGLAVAERLAQEGAKVVLSSRRKENVEDAVEKLRAKNLEVSGIACHQAKKEDRQRLIDFAINTYGGIDVLFISAGVNPHRGSLLKVTEQQWDKLFDVNVKSTFLMIRECVPHLSARGGGAIVTNSTVATLFPDRMGHHNDREWCYGMRESPSDVVPPLLEASYPPPPTV